ncbi:MAG TPA: rhomboid family intramembrane serine protease [Chitinophagaceae bacterium]|nr:rhomboid family intramembrane serine protease [Chitinophagaceae bacterium]
MSFRYTRPDTFPPVIKNLLFINGLFFLASAFLLRDKVYFDNYEEYGLLGVLGLWPIGHENFRPYQIFTHMFTHADIGHIFFNMFNLWMFGRILENVWGAKKFLLFYLICGIGAAAAHLAVQYLTGGYTPAVGASGAVMGVMVGFAYLFPNTELMFIFFPIPIKAKWVVLLMIALDLFGGFGRISSGIAHWAHLGGAATGFVLVYLWNKTNKKTFY